MAKQLVKFAPRDWARWPSVLSNLYVNPTGIQIIGALAVVPGNWRRFLIHSGQEQLGIQTLTTDDLTRKFEQTGYIEVEHRGNVVRASQPDDSTNPYTLDVDSDSPNTAREVYNSIWAYRTSATRSVFFTISDTAYVAPATPEVPATPDATVYTARPPGGGRRRKEMYMGEFRRDVQLVDLGGPLALLATTPNVPTSRVPRVKTNGVVYDQYAELTFSVAAVAAAAGKMYVGGRLMRGPGAVPDGRTPYRLVGSFVSNAHLELMIGYGPAAPTAAASGQQIIGAVVVEASPSGDLQIDRLIALKAEYLVDGTTVLNPLFIGIAVVNPTAKAASYYLRGTLSIQRLVGAPPLLVDRNIG